MTKLSYIIYLYIIVYFTQKLKRVGEKMKNGIKSKIIISSLVIISLLLISGCNLLKYNTKGNFNIKQSQKLCSEKKYDEALKNVDKFLQKYPNNTLANSQKGYILIASGKNEEGLVVLTDLAENHVASSTDLNNISWAYNNLHMYKLANRYADMCLKSGKATDVDYINKGNALHGLKKLDEAISYYDKALVKNPKSPLALWGKGLCLYEKKEFKECLVFFRQYLELGGDNNSASYYISKVYIELKDLNGGINEFKNLISKNPKDDSLYMSLGYMYFDQGDFNSAINCYDSIIKRSSDYADAYYEKSVCLVRLSKKDEACESLKMAIQYDEEYIYDAQDEPEFDPIRNYDKFKKLVEEVPAS